MQGGEIGVASQEKKGSTFQFYIKTRRTAEVIEKSQTPGFQLLVREDALREACADEIPAVKSRLARSRAVTASETNEPQLQKGITMPNAQPETVQPKSSATHPPQLEHFNILVVEDNLVNQKVVSKQLRKAGHFVHVANHGEEALDFIKRSEYWHAFETGYAEKGESLSVVLMDLEMPVMDGISCVKIIRELQGRGKIRGHVPVIAVTANARKDQIFKSLEAGVVSCSLILFFGAPRGMECSWIVG
jgi:CheY-like chemotaxis protein